MSNRRGPRPVSLRLRRLLVMLPWLYERGTVSIDEMAAHFRLSVDELVADLTLASMCGISQDPLDLIEVWIDEGEVHCEVPKYFDRPLRLTTTEAFSLIASAEAVRDVFGENEQSPLARAVAKVAAAVGPWVPDVAVEMDAPDIVEQVNGAVRQSQVVEIGYWNVDDGAVRERRIVPVEVFQDHDHWYVRAVDLSVEGERIFRLDRIDSIRLTGESRQVTLAPRRSWFDDSADARVITIDIDPDSAWMLENVPVLERDGHRVKVVAASDRWLERLILRLGPRSQVVDPPDAVVIASEAARRVLARYDTK